MPAEEILISIVVAPSLEAALVDWLLDHEQVTGFTSLPVNGHGSSIHSMSLAEQVAGSQRKLLFQVHLPATQAHALIEALRSDFANAGIHYWLTPLLAGGRI